MNAAIDYLPGTAFAPDARRLKRVAAGVAISLALHALLLSLYRQPHTAPATPAPEPLTVRLRQAVPPASAPAPKTSARPRREKPEPPARHARPSRPVIAMPLDTRPSAADVHAVDPAPVTAPKEDAAPAFDIAAARSLARKFAHEPDPAKAGTALERLPPKPLETESRLARGIQAAKRANCKDGVPGGLLAPLYLMMEKKDSGCKW